MNFLSIVFVTKCLYNNKFDILIDLIPVNRTHTLNLLSFVIKWQGRMLLIIVSFFKISKIMGGATVIYL